MTKNKKPWWKRLLKIFLWLTLLPVVLIIVLVSILYFSQDHLVTEALDMVNKDFKGRITIKDSHVAPFHDFPKVDLDIEGLCIYEDKNPNSKPIVELNDIYVAFDAMKILEGHYDVSKVEADGGNLFIVQDTTGNFNILNAFETGDTVTMPDTSVFEMHLKSIKLKDISITKINESNKIKILGKFKEVNASFLTGKERTDAKLDGKFNLTILKGKDTTFVRNKNITVNSAVRYANKYDLLTVDKSTILLEDVLFSAQGKMLMKEDLFMDMKFAGERSDFNLLFAFLPPDLEQYMKRYTSTGLLYFDAAISGIVNNGRQPKIQADFGCKNGYFKNANYNRKLEDLAFTGYFTNGTMRNLTTMEVGLLDIYAIPEEGEVFGSIVVRNFKDPNVSMDVRTEFDLEYLQQFLQLQDLKNIKGQVSLKVHYDELVDIQVPRSSFTKLKQGVDSELKIKDLSFKVPGYPHAIKKLNLFAQMRKKEVTLDAFSAIVGSSDILMSAKISSLPEILHKTDKMVNVSVALKSKKLNLRELSTFDSAKIKPIDECLTDFAVSLNLHTSAKKITDTLSKLPVGDYKIGNLTVQLQHFAKPIKDLNADIHIDTSKIAVKGFKGMVGKSNFDIDLVFKNYAMWFKRDKVGTSNFDFVINSDSLRIFDFTKFKGVHTVAKEIRREKFKELHLEGIGKIVYDKDLKLAECSIPSASARVMIHPLKIENISGKIKYSDNRIRIRKMNCKMGKNEFTVSLGYYLGNAEEAKKDNRFTLKAKYFNLDELTKLNERKKSKKDTLPEPIAAHDSVFNVFSLPFSNMKIKLDIGELIYKGIGIKKIKARMRMQRNHFFYIDTLNMDIADGHIDIDGHFNGSDKSHIFFIPNVSFNKVDLNKLFLKFDNFGQNYILSDNVSGIFTGKLSGKIRMHTDLLPIIDQSEVHLETFITNGALNNYGPMSMLSDYFKDKNLNNIRFDTLANTFSLKKGVLIIPSMNINSSLGFVEVSGTQALTTEKNEMDYLVKVPMKMVTDVGFKYLFGKKREEMDSTQVDDIIVRDETKKTKFLNLSIKGNSDDFKISLKKK